MSYLQTDECSDLEMRDKVTEETEKKTVFSITALIDIIHNIDKENKR